MEELTTRTLTDGSQTVITLSTDGTTFLVTAENEMGRSSVTVTAEEAYACYMHPFSRETWLDYPGFHVAESIGNAPEAFLAHTSDMEDLQS